MVFFSKLFGKNKKENIVNVQKETICFHPIVDVNNITDSDKSRVVFEINGVEYKSKINVISKGSATEIHFSPDTIKDGSVQHPKE